MIAPILNSVVIKGLYLFLKDQFQMYVVFVYLEHNGVM